jgi:hypothetical protein
LFPGANNSGEVLIFYATYLEEVMKRNRKSNESGTVRVELKYCEHCGGLWVREGGAGVYCEQCRAKVDDLPTGKKKPGKVMLPIARPTVVEDFGCELPGDEETEFEAAGGVA